MQKDDPILFKLLTNSKFVVLVIFLTTVVGSIGVYTDISNKNQRELELSNKTKSGNSDFETILETMSPITDRMEHKTELLEDKIQKYYDELKDELNRQRVLIESIQKNTSILQDDSQNPTVGNTDSSPRVDRAHSIGTIGRPRRGTVGSQFPTSGTAKLGPSAIAWLAVQKGNLFWPKEPGILESGRWKRVVFEGGPPGSLDLVLIAVSRDTDRAIRAWLEDGKRTGSFPGLLLSDYEVLDTVRLTLK